jgi:hypothetical protein
VRAAVTQLIILNLVLLTPLRSSEIAVAEDNSGQCTVRNGGLPAQGRQTGVIRTIAGVTGIALIVQDGVNKKTIPISAGLSFLSGITRLEDGLRGSYSVELDQHCLIWVSNLQIR